MLGQRGSQAKPSDGVGAWSAYLQAVRYQPQAFTPKVTQADTATGGVSSSVTNRLLLSALFVVFHATDVWKGSKDNCWDGVESFFFSAETTPSICLIGRLMPERIYVVGF